MNEFYSDIKFGNSAVLEHPFEDELANGKELLGRVDDVDLELEDLTDEEASKQFEVIQALVESVQQYLFEISFIAEPTEDIEEIADDLREFLKDSSVWL